MQRRNKLMMILLFTALTTQSQDRVSGRAFATRSAVMAQHGIACTSQPLATMAAIDVLKKGGTAVDAAIAANAVLGVVEPAMNGIGGDLFAIVYDAKTKKLYGLNASGRSPYSLSLGEFRKKNLSSIPIGPLSVSVPGCVDGWFELNKRFGRKPMQDLLQYAVQYARDGFPVADETAFVWKASEQKLSKYPNGATVYLPNGKPLQRGELFKNPQLASTLEKIARNGRDAFYKGDIARAIDAYMKKTGGYLSYQDLADHVSNWVEPVSTTYRGYRVWELPPNGQGIATLQMLNILEGFDFSKIAYGSPEHLHLFVEAKKLAYEDRAKYYADMDFAKVPVQRLISKSYAEERRKLIRLDKASDDFSAGDAALGGGETVYLTVADEAGN
ncbi:MAG TPA: gamma-glutamyltransferase family protein, partial [Puia sp.]|nr:gamma-glutamyltransferase family protein [Puia sp.]